MPRRKHSETLASTVPKSRRKRRTRLEMYGKQSYSAMLSVAITPDLLIELDELCADYHMTRAALLRPVIEAAIAEARRAHDSGFRPMGVQREGERMRFKDLPWIPKYPKSKS